MKQRGTKTVITLLEAGVSKILLQKSIICNFKTRINRRSWHIIFAQVFFPPIFPFYQSTDVSMWSIKNKVFWFECKIQISGFRSHLLTYCWWYFSPAKKMKIISACIWLSIIFAFMSIWPWFEYIRQKPRKIFIINSQSSSSLHHLFQAIKISRKYLH